MSACRSEPSLHSRPTRRLERPFFPVEQAGTHARAFLATPKYLNTSATRISQFFLLATSLQASPGHMPVSAVALLSSLFDNDLSFQPASASSHNAARVEPWRLRQPEREGRGHHGRLRPAMGWRP